MIHVAMKMNGACMITEELPERAWETPKGTLRCLRAQIEIGRAALPGFVAMLERLLSDSQLHPERRLGVYDGVVVRTSLEPELVLAWRGNRIAVPAGDVPRLASECRKGLDEFLEPQRRIQEAYVATQIEEMGE